MTALLVFAKAGGRAREDPAVAPAHAFDGSIGIGGDPATLLRRLPGCCGPGAACLLALDVGGEPLHVDHGAPVRLIGPNRPGVLQTKWVGRIVVL